MSSHPKKLKARRRPYGLHLNWEVIHAAGQARSIDMFLNFPIADMNRSVFWRHPQGVADSDIDRMNAFFWGDESWRSVVYRPARGLFDLFASQKPVAHIILANRMVRR